MNVFIVDDRPSNLKLLRAVLEAEGLTVCEAADGLEAISMLMRGRVDAIISDILMPRMDGYRLCMEVRANHRFCDLPFIAYTATYTSARDEKLMADLGADRFLRKPTSAAVLTATVEDVVQAKRRRPPTPARIRPEPELLEEYNERLAAKLEERNVAREAQAEPVPAIEHHGLPSSTQWQRLLDHSPAMIYSLKWEDEKIIPCLISESMSHFLGFTVAECLDGEWWVGQLHPEDRVAAVASILETVALGFSRSDIACATAMAASGGWKISVEASSTQPAIRWSSPARGQISPSAKGRRRTGFDSASAGGRSSRFPRKPLPPVKRNASRWFTRKPRGSFPLPRSISS